MLTFSKVCRDGACPLKENLVLYPLIHIKLFKLWGKLLTDMNVSSEYEYKIGKLLVPSSSDVHLPHRDHF